MSELGSEIGKGTPQLTLAELDELIFGDSEGDEIERLCDKYGLKLSDNPKDYQELMVDGKLLKISTYRKDFGTILEDNTVKRERKEEKKKEETSSSPFVLPEVDKSFSSEEFSAGATKKFIDEETGETREGEVVSLRAVEGKKIVELKMDDGSVEEVSLANILEK